MAQPLNIAFGTEVRNETYGVKAGEVASYTVGPGAAIGLDANSNGAPGFSDRQAAGVRIVMPPTLTSKRRSAKR
jgi:iron complex outermembrane receptor protein